MKIVMFKKLHVVYCNKQNINNVILYTSVFSNCLWMLVCCCLLFFFSKDTCHL